MLCTSTTFQPDQEQRRTKSRPVFNYASTKINGKENFLGWNLMKISKVVSVRPSNHLPRWLAHERCVIAVKENYCGIVLGLNDIYEETHEPEALGISKALSKKSTISAIFLLDYTLTQVAKLSKPLQAVELDLSIISALVDSTLHTLLSAASWVSGRIEELQVSVESLKNVLNAKRSLLDQHLELLHYFRQCALIDDSLSLMLQEFDCNSFGNTWEETDGRIKYLQNLDRTFQAHCDNVNKLQIDSTSLALIFPENHLIQSTITNLKELKVVVSYLSLPLIPVVVWFHHYLRALRTHYEIFNFTKLNESINFNDFRQPSSLNPCPLL
ncbi:hypothetical protein LOD99_11319 [Oopsacas minuta]|uniref:Uncharacterized protein n=1 Tax=Oopsacas minuta TaxID=111878 RepID=A0AAV7K4S4_9METZ|nr:hypothetical protein LOD99_11319 [Oopsacas minuta]